jgi:hypothetical protein
MPAHHGVDGGDRTPGRVQGGGDAAGPDMGVGVECATVAIGAGMRSRGAKSGWSSAAMTARSRAGDSG